MVDYKKEGWTEDHFETHRIKKIYEAQIQQAEEEYDKVTKEYRNKMEKLNKRMARLQSQCKHIDDHGPFIATCFVCGWADYYGDC